MESNSTSTVLFDRLGNADNANIPIPSTTKNAYVPTYASAFSPQEGHEQEQLQELFLLDENNQDLVDLFQGVYSSQLPQAPGLVVPADSEENDLFQCMSDGTSSQDGLDELLRMGKETFGNAASPEANSTARLSTTVPGHAPPRRRPRKQNHACDQCRIAKRACNFGNDVPMYKQKPLTPCTTCTSRSLECTGVWLETKKAALEQAKRRANKTTTQNAAEDMPKDGHGATGAPVDQYGPPISRPEAQLVRHFSADETCKQHFNLYVDVFDMPLSQCLLQGSMPSRYLLGVAALHPLRKRDSFSHFLRTADRWVSSCWNPLPEARASMPKEPYLFRTAAVLDSVFEHQSTRNQPNHLKTRDESINATYKWVALATTAQFSLNPADDKAHSRDIAYAAWQKAKQMAFDNIAATGSFRLALALLLFGFIEPPGSIEQIPALQEASTYALCEGAKRLRTLCRQARLCLGSHLKGRTRRCFWDKANAGSTSRPAHNLPSEVRENLLELIAAVEWLYTVSAATKIVMSRGKIQPLSDELDQLPAKGWPEIYDQTRESDFELSKTRSEDGSGLGLTAQYSQDGLHAEPVTTLMRRGTPESTVLQNVRYAGLFVILLWNLLARLTLACESATSTDRELEEVHQLYSNITSIIKLWRSTFGTFDELTTSCFQQAQPEIRRQAAFCSNDGNLAILYYFDIVQSLEYSLLLQPQSKTKQALYDELQSTQSFRTHQRLVSAIQVSTFSCSCQGAFSPGFQGSGGLKAQLQDITAHPVCSVKDSSL
jgi:hypothetical protein